jgi:DNA replication and repair protein RecF
VPSFTHITHLSLTNFRNHSTYDVATDAPFVILTGVNGAGKTNVLEAVSLLTTGKGFRNASATEQRHHQFPEMPWAIRATIREGTQESLIATGSTPTKNSVTEKRVIKVNGQPLTRHSALLEILNILWFLPTMSHLFQEGATAKRKYLDRIVYGFDKDHASRIHAWEHYVRERRKLLSTPLTENAWISTIEKKMSQIAVAIAYARVDTVVRMNQALTHIIPVFPHAHMAVSGDAESLLQRDIPALEVEALLSDMLQTARYTDRMSGRCSVGAHKTRLDVTFVATMMPAEHCSTGEQKALLLSLLLAQIDVHQQWFCRTPVILLDEITAHLDSERRNALFHALHAAKAQVWATGTDAADFSTVPKDVCCHLHL